MRRVQKGVGGMVWSLGGRRLGGGGVPHSSMRAGFFWQRAAIECFGEQRRREQVMDVCMYSWQGKQLLAEKNVIAHAAAALHSFLGAGGGRSRAAR